MHRRLNPKRSIPAVAKILDAIGEIDLPRRVIVATVREELDALRRANALTTFDEALTHVRHALKRLVRSRLQPVINGTGVVLHTNFGRATFAPTTALMVAQIASNYSNLEFDLAAGQRGHRGSYLERSLAILCEAEAATVVNNCAAALVLIARRFARGEDEIIISRGELVQIGGGFRIGEILEDAGVKLREIGATNRTSLGDYRRAINRHTAMILRVHRSNFFMEGFVESPSTREIAELARRRRIPFVVDLGSGALEPLDDIVPGEQEPTPCETLRAGANLVCFSGDKLFGGAQAGIIAGKRRLIETLKRNPLFRALRCDKLTLAALQMTTDIHLNADPSGIPALALLRTSKDDLRARAANIFARLRGLPARVSIGRGSTGKVGGGSLPRSVVSSVTIDIVPELCSLKEFALRLREATPPVIGYIAQNSFKLDLRTILPQQDELVVDAVRVGCSSTAPT